MIHYWGTEDKRDESGLTQRINWKWFVYDVAELFTVMAGVIAAFAAILIASKN